jgi:hypothetical protein
LLIVLTKTVIRQDRLHLGEVMPKPVFRFRQPKSLVAIVLKSSSSRLTPSSKSFVALALPSSKRFIDCVSRSASFFLTLSCAFW